MLPSLSSLQLLALAPPHGAKGGGHGGGGGAGHGAAAGTHAPAGHGAGHDAVPGWLGLTDLPEWVDPSLDVLTIVFLALGAFLVLTGALGVIRMPDVFARMHPAGKGDTMGQTLVLVGLVFQATDPFMALKLLIIVAVLWITAPTSTHALAVAAWRDGHRPLLGEAARQAVRDNEGREDAA